MPKWRSCQGPIDGVFLPVIYNTCLNLCAKFQLYINFFGFFIVVFYSRSKCVLSQRNLCSHAATLGGLFRISSNIFRHIRHNSHVGSVYFLFHPIFHSLTSFRMLELRILNDQKKPLEVFCKKRCSYRKTSVLKYFFDKAPDQKAFVL